MEQLEQAPRGYIDHHNAKPKSFVWTRKAEGILMKAASARAALSELSTARDTTLAGRLRRWSAEASAGRHGHR